MTAPDHTPFLLPTDLRTPEDVARCVISFALDPDVEYDATDVFNYLSARIDRERRQACRRGASQHIRWARTNRDNVDEWSASDAADPTLWDSLTERDEWVATAKDLEAKQVRKALAFRAAARQP